jgi:hypothetical protein
MSRSILQACEKSHKNEAGGELSARGENPTGIRAIKWLHRVSVSDNPTNPGLGRQYQAGLVDQEQPYSRERGRRRCLTRHNPNIYTPSPAQGFLATNWIEFGETLVHPSTKQLRAFGAAPSKGE